MSDKVTENKVLYRLIFTVTAACAVMAFTDGVVKPIYSVKSLIKIIVFFVVPVIFTRFFPKTDAFSFMKPNKKGIGKAFLLGAAVYALILGGYFALSGTVDFSNIVSSLSKNVGVTKENFLFVSLYISFVNSLLEEFFFRGFVFNNVLNLSGKKLAYYFSAGAFSMYHIAMMTDWFEPLFFLLILVGLFAAGLIFDRLNEKNGSVYTSWFVHMFANFAINTVGFILMNR